ncbi:MAG: DNA polymerase III subunit delta [Dictyoglomus sp.]|nr:DNA polymerase III subunit delta [Dictyoglomus sp.]MCX7844999.1 DNA polymerase III subunit delta [Dictyoglomaceae bacterium]MDW8187736.1 DNA polymerase III subunit delta [Dictyoglomus sp.]
MNYWEFKKLIKQKEIPLVYLFIGEEKFLMEDALESLRNRFKSASYHVFFGEDITWKEIIPFLEAPPLFENQLLVIRHCQNLKEPKEKDKIISLLKKPMNTCIVFMANGEEEIKKKNYLEKIIPGNGIVEFSKLRAEGVRRWLNEKLKELNITLDSDAQYFLTISWGDNLAFLYKELEKVVSFVGERKEVTLEDLKKVSSPKEVAFFTFLDALYKRDVYLLLSGLDTLWNEGIHPMVILDIIIKQIRQILRIYALSKEGFSEEEIREKLDLHPFVIKKTLQNLTNFTAAELFELYFLLRQLDQEIKSTSKNPRILLEKFLIRINKKF